ncbi:5-hydroxytryptamine receptor 2A-like [Exaiptasia diaphana]|uniref:G-protein coupled receptors family 1 profile domain-containing protein n=1 Tax=Exaiptasia diaphana TaxID=2652724 RepID=A0A913WPI8_EXADI|nr:5-hydroxytryptamine receptor 2A-like [Exaiptasia diaphana]XP_020892136.1 5-hydroxytryptamine receptor 2A-like [Exaiptasia diaphana]
MAVWFVMFGLEALVIVTGNALVIAALTLSRLHRKRRYYLIANLAIADLMVGMVTLPLYIYHIIQNQNTGVRTAFILFDIMFGVESLLGLLTLALERLYAICWPMNHRTVKRNHLLLIIVCTWMISAVTGFTTLLNPSQNVFFFYILPLLTTIHVIICISYSTIWWKVRSTPVIGEHAQEQRVRHERTLAKTLFIVTVLSILAWLPAEILNIILPFCLPCQRTLTQFAYLAKFLQFGNSFINPIVYVLRIPEFRKSTRRLFSRYSVRRKYSSRRSSKMIKTPTLIVTMK